MRQAFPYMNPHTVAPLVEALESRIAPATRRPVGKVVAFTDVDGDLVTIKFSKPILTDANVASVIKFDGSMFGATSPQQLEDIDLLNVASAAKGANVTVTAKRAADGA